MQKCENGQNAKQIKTVKPKYVKTAKTQKI